MCPKYQDNLFLKLTYVMYSVETTQGCALEQHIQKPPRKRKMKYYNIQNQFPKSLVINFHSCDK